MSDSRARFLLVSDGSENHTTTETGPPLSEREFAALASAGSWYANYHARIIAEQADDESAYAVARRERYEDLVSALRKLGVRVSSVEPPSEQRAA